MRNESEVRGFLARNFFWRVIEPERLLFSPPLPLARSCVRAPARGRPTAGPSRVRSQSAGGAREPAAQGRCEMASQPVTRRRLRVL